MAWVLASVFFLGKGLRKKRCFFGVEHCGYKWGVSARLNHGVILRRLLSMFSCIAVTIWMGWDGMGMVWIDGMGWE